MKKPVLLFVVVAPLAVAGWYFMQRDQGVDIIAWFGGPLLDSTARTDGVAGGAAADSASEEPAMADTSEPQGPLQVGGNVLPPVRIEAPQPRYTETAKTARIQGVVMAQTVIDNQGNVIEVKILKGLPMGLDQEAVKAIKTWKFEPATLNGKPVSVYHSVTVNFFLP